MSGPDGIDERFGTLVGELRTGEAAASPELRERIRTISTRHPEPSRALIRARLRRRRVALVLVPVCALVAAAVGLGVYASGGSRKQDATPAPARGKAALRVPPLERRKPVAAAEAPAPSGSRAQIYSADLRLRVSDLAGATKQAIALTRRSGGYVVSVDYGSGQRSGEAELVVRVPIVRVQAALARLTSLGTLVADHVSIRDVQGQLDRRSSRMADLRAQVAGLRAKVAETGLAASRRAFFEEAIARRQSLLAELRHEQTAQTTRASFAAVSLDLAP